MKRERNLGSNFLQIDKRLLILLPRGIEDRRLWNLRELLRMLRLSEAVRPIERVVARGLFLGALHLFVGPFLFRPFLAGLVLVVFAALFPFLGFGQGRRGRASGQEAVSHWIHIWFRWWERKRKGVIVMKLE